MAAQECEQISWLKKNSNCGSKQLMDGDERGDARVENVYKFFNSVKFVPAQCLVTHPGPQGLFTLCS